MNNIIQNLSEITDSREMLEAKPHKFTSTFAYGLIAILVIALTWTYFGEIDIVVKSNGVVKSNDKTISVLNEVEGKVSDVSFKEGQKVKKGDILYSLECKDSILSKNNYDKQLTTLQTSTNNMGKLRNSILDNKNNFDNNNVDEKDYYNKYLQYTTTNEKLLLTQKQAVLQATVTNDNKLSSSKSTTQQISESNDVINSLNVLLQSINDNKSNFSDLNIKGKLDDANRSTEKLQAELQQAKLTPELDGVNNQLATNDITKYKMDTLVQLDDGIRQNQQKLDELKTNIGSLQLNIDKSTVKAPIDGIVSIKNDISKSQLVKGGQEVLSVIPQNSSQYRVQLYASNKDIIGMKIGEKIKYHFQALPYKEYGELTGSITDIAVDSTVDQQSGASYYLVQSEILNKPLFSYKGEKGELKIGMTCEAQVITKRKKILYFLLEKINLKN